MAGDKVSQLPMPSSHNASWCYIFPRLVLHRHLPIHDKINVIYQSRPYSCSVLQFSSCAHCWCFRWWTSVSIGWSAAMQPYTQQIVIHYVFWHLSIRNSRNLFSNLSYSSWSVGLDHMGQFLLPLCVSEPVCWWSCRAVPTHKPWAQSVLLMSNITHPLTGE